jgi:hypothetical protein
MEQPTAAPQQTPTPAEIVAGIPDLKPGQTWFVGDVHDGEYRVTAQGFSRRRYVTQRCRAAVRPRGAGRPAASRTASRSTAAAAGDPDLPSDQPSAAIAAPTLPRPAMPAAAQIRWQAMTAAAHPPASTSAGAETPRPDRSTAVGSAAVGILFHENGDSFALDAFEIDDGFVWIKGRHRRVTGARGSEIVRFGPDVNRVFPASKIVKIVEGNR